MNNTNVPAGSLLLSLLKMTFRTHVAEGVRIFRHSLDRRVRGHRKYSGNAAEICRQIVRDCWNGSYFQTSTGHFCQFYARDFGICTDALLRQGYREEVIKTLQYALEKYSAHGKITVSITPNGKPFDFPSQSIDSVALLVRSLRAANAHSLVEKYVEFLNSEISKLYSQAIEKDTGLVERNKTFSSMKDYSKRKSSCYDNVMIALLKNELKILKLSNPFKKHNYEQLIKNNFWTGNYFLDDLSGSRHIAGDANVFPYWANIFNSETMLKKSLIAIREEKLDKPFPLKYAGADSRQDMITYELLVRGWQKDAIWANMGPIYIRLLGKTDKREAERNIERYKKLIESNRNYMELFDNAGNQFKTPFYHSDEGMLWASLYLDLVKK